jgi:uncharacterized membrane protein YoaK (UPF0700 family)
MSSPDDSPLKRFACSPLPLFVLVGIAGGTDALTMLHSKELLAVYMTGNSTKLGQSLVSGAWSQALPLACVIATFFISTTLAAWIGSRLPAWRAAICLVLTAALLLIAIPFAGEQWSPAGTAIVAASMGVINQTRADQPGVTFITGLLIQTGRHLADGHFAQAAANALRWLSLVIGAAVGALLDYLYGTGALAILAGIALVCAIAAALYRQGGESGAAHRTSSTDGGISHARK